MQSAAFFFFTIIIYICYTLLDNSRKNVYVCYFFFYSIFCLDVWRSFSSLDNILKFGLKYNLNCYLNKSFIFVVVVFFVEISKFKLIETKKREIMLKQKKQLIFLR